MLSSVFSSLDLFSSLDMTDCLLPASRNPSLGSRNRPSRLLPCLQLHPLLGSSFRPVLLWVGFPGLFSALPSPHRLCLGCHLSPQLLRQSARGTLKSTAVSQQDEAPGPHYTTCTPFWELSLGWLMPIQIEH